jgi:acyl-CoA thioesterase YciA
VAVDRIVFHSPVQVGDEVTVVAELLSVGHASMWLKMAAWCRPRDGEESAQVTEAVLTFVAIAAQGRSRPVPLGLSGSSSGTAP